MLIRWIPGDLFPDSGRFPADHRSIRPIFRYTCRIDAISEITIPAWSAKVDGQVEEESRGGVPGL